jgi:hypothetical protein
MRGGTVDLKVRKALAYDTRPRLGLDLDPKVGRPEDRHVVLLTGSGRQGAAGRHRRKLVAGRENRGSSGSGKASYRTGARIRSVPAESATSVYETASGVNQLFIDFRSTVT